MDEDKLESALGDTFAPDPAPAKLDIPEPAAPEPATQPRAAPEDGEPAPEGPTEPAPPEPEFEFEFEGKTHKLIGRETIQAELAKARDYSQKTEQIARMREALVANAQLQQAQSEFQGSIMADIAELRMIDSRLEQFGKVDWNAAIDSNFTEAMKLQEQRNQLKQLRDAKLGELNQKQQQFQQGRATAAMQLLAAEGQALVDVAKLGYPQTFTNIAMFTPPKDRRSSPSCPNGATAKRRLRSKRRLSRHLWATASIKPRLTA